METEQTKLKDIDEELRQRLIINLLEKADEFTIVEDYEKAYRTYRAIFNKIRPFDFRYKNELETLCKNIDMALNESRGQPVDGYHKIKIQEKQIEFLELVDLLSKHIPNALKDLNLYFKIIDQVLDDDEYFFDGTFSLKKSLMPEKKKELCKLSTEDLLKHLSTRQINDVYSRYEIKKIMEK